VRVDIAADAGPFRYPLDEVVERLRRAWVLRPVRLVEVDAWIAEPLRGQDELVAQHGCSDLGYDRPQFGDDGNPALPPTLSDVGRDPRESRAREVMAPQPAQLLAA
jgi:hypothetical protein